VDFRREFDHPAKGLSAPGTIKRASLPQSGFHRMICLEERRAERSRKSILLMLLDVNGLALGQKESFFVNQKMISVLSPITRETDFMGWYKENSVVGLVFTEIIVEDLSSVTAIMNRISKTLKAHLSAKQFSDINISFRLLPEAYDDRFIPVGTTSVAYPIVSAVRGTETLL
jgi:hypothetical protein